MASSEDHRKKDSELLARRAAQVQAGGARAAVLGVNDGLVSTLCIVLAVAGAGAATQSVLIAGLAGLIAGAISMAVGEWISVTSQVDLFKGVLKDLKSMVVKDRTLLIEQVSDSFQNTGINKTTADHAAAEVGSNDDHLFEVYANRVIGLNPDELGSPWTAAFSSFAFFVIGALVALLPWFFATDNFLAVVLSINFTAIGGLIVGGYVARSSGNSISKGAFRQLLIIIVASAVTYGVGYLFGTQIN
jgi:VIT1/CCC1 family predicted Fe2+/Mn2+ transporter